MSSYNEKRKRVQRIVLCAAISVLIDNRRGQLFKKKQVEHFWRRSVFRDRKLHSQYYTLQESQRK